MEDLVQIRFVGDRNHSDRPLSDEEQAIASAIRQPLEGTLSGLGFSTDDGMRYLRRKGHLIHFFKLTVRFLTRRDNSVRSDGYHIGFHFGEALDLTPGLAIQTGQPTRATVVEENTVHYSVAKKSHYARSCARVCAAAQAINAHRWSLLQSEKDYSDFHLWREPSMEKVYLRTIQGRHGDADAWLRLLLHPWRDVSASTRDGAASGLEARPDPPDEPASTFRQLDAPARVRLVESTIKATIERNALGFLYAAA
ncbi:MAG: hypothetical protein JNM50_00490 [Chromatiales bacterium]|nr:hypothetical protein [Chromatiales bacterium]